MISSPARRWRRFFRRSRPKRWRHYARDIARASAPTAHGAGPRSDPAHSAFQACLKAAARKKSSYSGRSEGLRPKQGWKHRFEPVAPASEYEERLAFELSVI